MAAAQPAWSWQETQALLARLSQPSAAALHKEYPNIQRLTTFLNSDPEMTCHFDQLPRGQISSLLQRWCVLAKPILQVIINEADKIMTFPAAFSAVGTLLNALGTCLESWLQLVAAVDERRAFERQVAQHAADIAPVLARIMATIANQLSRVTPQHRAATAGAAAAAAHCREFLPTHPDMCMAAQLLGFWKSLALLRPSGSTLLRTGSSSSSRRARSNSSSSSSSSSGLQETVLPACDLAVNLLKTWPPKMPSASPSSSSSSSSSSAPEGYMPRESVTANILVVSNVLLDAVHAELLMDDGPQSPSDARFLDQLSASASLQHLLLICVADACHRLHQESHGVSQIKAKAAAAAVTSSAAIAAAAAAAEAAATEGDAERQLYISVPPHHIAVLDMLLAPAINMDPTSAGRPKAQLLQHAMHTTVEFLLLCHTSGTTTTSSSSSSSGRRLGKVTELPRIPVELCAPLHSLLSEAAVLAPGLPSMHMALIFQMSLLDVYTQAKIGRQVTPATVNAAMRGYTGGLPASLLLMGPAVLHAYKHSKEGDVELPPGGGGCPVGPDGMPKKGGLLRDAAVNLFGSVTVKMCAPGVQDVLQQAFRQQPFTAAATCEAAVRGAARHNLMHAGAIRMFASLATTACHEAPHSSGSSSSSSERSIVTAAASDSRRREALLLQFALVTTQLKYVISSGNGANTLSALFQHVGPSARAVVTFSKLVEASIGMNSNDAIGGSPSSSSSSSSSVENDIGGSISRVAIMAPWLALAGRCLFVGGSQLLVAIESSAATAAPSLNANALEAIHKVLVGLFGCALVTGAQIRQLQVLQPEGAVTLGPMAAAHSALEALLDRMEAATKHLQTAMKRWKAASEVAAQAVAANAGGGSSMVWGKQLQSQLRACLGSEAAAEVRDAGSAVMAEFPVKLCCNNPGCGSMGKLGEVLQGQRCSSCKAAKYCSRECQQLHWKMRHKAVCKRIKEAAAAAVGAVAQ